MKEQIVVSITFRVAFYIFYTYARLPQAGPFSFFSCESKNITEIGAYWKRDLDFPNVTFELEWAKRWIHKSGKVSRRARLDAPSINAENTCFKRPPDSKHFEDEAFCASKYIRTLILPREGVRKTHTVETQTQQ